MDRTFSGQPQQLHQEAREMLSGDGNQAYRSLFSGCREDVQRARLHETVAQGCDTQEPKDRIPRREPGLAPAIRFGKKERDRFPPNERLDRLMSRPRGVHQHTAGLPAPSRPGRRLHPGGERLLAGVDA